MDDCIRICSAGKLPPFRLINAVAVMARIGARYGIDASDLLDGSGVAPDELDDPHKRISLLQEKTITRRFMDLVSVPWIGLEVGREYNFSANGKLGMAMMCCETALDALKLVLTYLPLTGSHHQYLLRIEGKTGYARFRELTDLDEFRVFCCEGEVGSIHAMARLSRIDSDVFRELHFAYPRPSYASRYEELFQCPVHFNAPAHMVVFDTRHLNTPLPLANPLARRALERDCDQMMPLLQAHDTVTARIHQELATHPDGFPTLDQLARRINLSPRTLRRRLLDESTSYKGILSDVRKTKALELLRTTSLSMENVAQHLGFSEVSSFYRAFKGWTGSTPSRFREKSL